MTFDSQIQSITQDEIVPIVTDQVLQSNVLGLVLLSKGRPWMGESLKFPIKLSKSTQGGSFTDYSTFNIGNENVRKVAAFDPRAYYQSVVIGGIARSVNAISKTQLLNLVKVEMESCQQDMANDVSTLLYGDGTGNANADFLGLNAAIDNGSNVDTYGGISRAVDTGWKSTIQTSVGAFDFSKQRTLANSATVGNQKPAFYVVDETTFGYIESDYTAVTEGKYDVVDGQRGRLTNVGLIPAARGGLVGQSGYDYLYYGGSPICKDDACPTQKEYAINPDFIRWYGVKAAEANAVDLKSMYHDGNDYDKAPSSEGFSWTGFVRPADQFAFIGQILLIGNLVCNAPRLESSSAGITS